MRLSIAYVVTRRRGMVWSRREEKRWWPYRAEARFYRRRRHVKRWRRHGKAAGGDM
jgi:hypothetical protein